MKMTKTQLKALIKECLVEVLTEGLGDNLSEVSRPKITASQRQMAESRRRQPQVPERRHVPSNMANTASRYSEVVKVAAGGNPILESIMADTAATTYQSQQAADRPGHHSGGLPKTGYELQVDQSTPEQLFGEEATSKWLSIMDGVGIGE